MFGPSTVHRRSIDAAHLLFSVAASVGDGRRIVRVECGAPVSATVLRGLTVGRRGRCGSMASSTMRRSRSSSKPASSPLTGPTRSPSPKPMLRNQVCARLFTKVEAMARFGALIRELGPATESRGPGRRMARMRPQRCCPPGQLGVFAKAHVEASRAQPSTSSRGPASTVDWPTNASRGPVEAVGAPRGASVRRQRFSFHEALWPRRLAEIPGLNLLTAGRSCMFLWGTMIDSPGTGSIRVCD